MPIVIYFNHHYGLGFIKLSKGDRVLVNNLVNFAEIDA